MADLEVKNFDSPDETRPFEGNGQVEIVTIEGRAIGRGTFEPGWRWSQNVKPIAGTDSCQTHHLGYVLSGRMKVFMDGGQEAEAGPGDVFMIHPGHDAEVQGDETCVTLEFGDAAHYATAS
jgi:hypothetical protein